MRIIGGKYRSRTLVAPSGLSTRPTSDRLRETLFNVLTSRIAGAHFLDLFAGSGAVGIEALSRDAATVDFVEFAPTAVKVLRSNLERLQLTTGFRIHSAAVGATLRKLAVTAKKSDTVAFDLIFLDPPYDAAAEYQGTLALLGGAASDLLAPETIVVAEHRRKEQLADRYGTLERTRLLEQGDAALSFYRIASDND